MIDMPTILPVPKSHAVCPDSKVRKLSSIRPHRAESWCSTLKLVPCSVPLSGQVLQGWRDDEGRFIPDRDSPAFRSLYENEFLDARWHEISETPLTLAYKAELQRALSHGPDDCGIPEGEPEGFEKMCRTRQLDTGHWVHGIVGMAGMFFPHKTCPNAPLIKANTDLMDLLGARMDTDPALGVDN